MTLKSTILSLLVAIFSGFLIVPARADLNGSFGLGYFHYLDNLKYSSVLYNDNIIIDNSKLGDRLNDINVNPEAGPIRIDTIKSTPGYQLYTKSMGQTGIGYFKTSLNASEMFGGTTDLVVNGTGKYNLYGTYTSYGGDRKNNYRLRDGYLQLFKGKTIELALGRVTQYYAGTTMVDGGSLNIRFSDFFKLGVFGGLRPNPVTFMPDFKSYAGGTGLHLEGEKFNNHTSFVAEFFTPQAGATTNNSSVSTTPLSATPQIDRMFLANQTGIIFSQRVDFFGQIIYDIATPQITDLFANLNFQVSKTLLFALKFMQYRNFIYKTSKILEIYPENEEEEIALGKSLTGMNHAYSNFEFLTEIKPTGSLSIYASPEMRIRYYGADVDYKSDKYIIDPFSDRLAYGATLGFRDFRFLGKKVEADSRLTLLDNFETFNVISSSNIGKFWTPSFFTSVNLLFENDKRDRTNLVFTDATTPYMETENIFGTGILVDWFLSSHFNFTLEYSFRYSDEPINHGGYDLSPPYPDKKLTEHLIFAMLTYRIKGLKED